MPVNILADENALSDVIKHLLEKLAGFFTSLTDIV